MFVYQPRKLPRDLSLEEIFAAVEAAPAPEYTAALSVAYGQARYGKAGEQQAILQQSWKRLETNAVKVNECGGFIVFAAVAGHPDRSK